MFRCSTAANCTNLAFFCTWELGFWTVLAAVKYTLHTLLVWMSCCMFVWKNCYVALHSFTWKANIYFAWPNLADAYHGVDTFPWNNNPDVSIASSTCYGWRLFHYPVLGSISTAWDTGGGSTWQAGVAATLAPRLVGGMRNNNQLASAGNVTRKRRLN
jgi:hypothetical protein